MRKLIFITICLFSISKLFSQLGISSEPPHTKAELEIKSPGNNTGVLIPRMTTAEISAIPSPATGLLTYSTDNNAFYYYNAGWHRIGEECSIIQDSDADTKIEADNGSDNDEIHFTAAGTLTLKIDSNGIVQNVGDLQKTNGSITINNAYTLTTTDGNNKNVMKTDGAGNLSWQNPATLPGLVAGIVTFPLVSGRETAILQDKAWYTAIIPWSDITVNNISFFLNVAGTPVVEIGIYDNAGTRLGTDSVQLSTTGFQFATVTLDSNIKLKAGKLYRIGVSDRYRSGSTFLENPYYDGSGLHWEVTYTSTPQVLPSTISSYGTGQKPIWLCLY